MQHCTKLPLLISNIRKYTIGEDDKVQLTTAIGKVEVSLRKYHNVTAKIMSELQYVIPLKHNSKHKSCISM